MNGLVYMILPKFLVILTLLSENMLIFSPVLIFAQRSEQVKPNVLIILADDQGWGDLSINGNSNLNTPNIDGLAREGARFEYFYVCPVCSPTRAEFLTGRYHPRGGVYSTSAGGERLDLDERTLGDTFKAAGYVTGAFGKWHNGSQWPYHPNARGFDEFYGFCSGHWGNYFDPRLEHNRKPVKGNGFIIDDLTERAMQFMEQNRSKPFLCYLPYNTPHSPMQVPDRFYKKFIINRRRRIWHIPAPHWPCAKTSIGMSAACL
jgi:arylsulfatase A-like enzyme